MNPSEEKKIIVITRAFGPAYRNEYDPAHPFNKVTCQELKKGKLNDFLMGKGAEEGSIFLRYKKLEGKEIYLLPCYKEGYEEKNLSYTPSQERFAFLRAIIGQFALPANRANELYIHDTEWGSPYYDYNALTEIEGENKDGIAKHFSGVFVFAHSPVSEYYQRILMKAFDDAVLSGINSKREALISIEKKSPGIPDAPAGFPAFPRQDNLEAIAEFTYDLLKL